MAKGTRGGKRNAGNMDDDIKAYLKEKRSVIIADENGFRKITKELADMISAKDEISYTEAMRRAIKETQAIVDSENKASDFQKTIDREGNKIKRQRARYNELSNALDNGKFITFVRKNDRGSQTDFRIEGNNVYYRAKEEGNRWTRSTMTVNTLKDRLNGWVTNSRYIVRMEK